MAYEINPKFKIIVIGDGYVISLFLHNFLRKFLWGSLRKVKSQSNKTFICSN